MGKVTYPDQSILRKEYDNFRGPRVIIARELEIRLDALVATLSSVPSVKARVKDFESYFKKYIRYLKDEGDFSPDRLITDIIGVRIVCPFLEDLAMVEELLKANLEITEVQHKGGDHTYREFGYESIHLLIRIPEDIARSAGDAACEIAEIQIRTILQDAWAEVEHELVYKAEFNPFDNPMKRKLAAVNASLSLADIIFQEIRSYQRQFNGQLEKRRDAFFKKIEESTDALLIAGEENPEPEASYPVRLYSNESIDELLLNALYAHNKHQFTEAIGFYTQILALNPDETISSLIYKHRGMAYFARSHYEEAIADFAKALDLDPQSYKAAYYQGIVCAVLRQYPRAVEAFNLSLKINPYQPYCLYRRGQAYFHLEDYSQALADCEAALALESFDGVRKFRQLIIEKINM